jgi:hypothetical protein
MRTLYVVPVLAIAAGVLSAAPATGALGGVEVTRSTARFDSVTGKLAAVEVALTNTSGKTVTAWSYDVEGTYADGSVTRSTATVDDISALLAPETRSRALAPGTSRTSGGTTLPLGKAGDLPTKVEATLTMVVFDDDLAAGDAQSIGRFGGLRRHIAAIMSALLDQVQEAIGAPDPRGALKALIEKYPGQGMYLQLLPMYDHGPAALEMVLSADRAYRDLMLQHSELKPVN